MKDEVQTTMRKVLSRMKKGQMIALAGLLVLALIGGVYAYWNQTSSIDNPFDTGRYGSTVREDFSPEDGENWQPGVTVDKVVQAVNTGDVDLIVRARLDEIWTRKGETTPYKDSGATTGGYNVYATSQADPDDGLTAADGSVVTKGFSSSANWIDGGDGWYYYKVNLEGGQTSDAWLESVTLLHNADMGRMETRKYVSVTDHPDESTWVWVEYTGTMPAYIGTDKVLHNKTETTYVQSGGSELLGYSHSDYTLTVTVQTVQATQAALDAVFGGGSAFTHPTGTTWDVK